MGKSLSTIEAYATHPSRQSTITRAQLIEAVDHAVARVHEHYNGPEVEIIDTAKQFARTTDKVDANTWLCTNSCGCPMTAVGAVTLKKFLGDDDARHSAPEVFAGAFDSKVQMLTGISRSATLTVVD